MPIPKIITVVGRKVEWVPVVPGHAGGLLGFGCTDLKFCLVSALAADSSSKLALLCSSSLAFMIMVQASSHLPTQFPTIFSVFLFVCLFFVFF